jgi:hypothetical protein
MPQKFQVNDKVQTNLAYTKGFDSGICPPSGLNWLKNLTVVKVLNFMGENETLEDFQQRTSKFSEPIGYICKSKSGKEYILNQCFLTK